MTIRHLTLSAFTAALLVPALAHAEVSVDATEVRSYELPANFALGQLPIQTTEDGSTVLAATIGDQTDAACTVVMATDTEAKSYEYQYQGGPTACVGVLPHPDGGFFVRGAQADAEEGDVFGLTARIGADGSEMWVVHDQELVDRQEGEFIGQYMQPHPELAFSADTNRLLGFSVGMLNVGGGQQLAQAHVLGGDSGRIQQSGKTFGTSGSAGFVAETITRTSDGDFLLYIYNAGSQGAHFFTYDGRINISTFEPIGEDWSQRWVRQMVYGPDGNVFLLWTPENDPTAPTNVTVVDDQAQEVWSSSWESTVENPDGGEPIALGAPQGMWVGSEHTLVLYSVAQGLMLRVADTATGESLGVAPLGGLTEHQPVAILNGADGSLKLLAASADGTEAFELRLDISAEGGDGGADAGGDAGGADAGQSSGGGGSDDGCATSAPSSPAPVSAAVLAFLLAVFTIANRKRFDLTVSDVRQSNRA